MLKEADLNKIRLEAIKGGFEDWVMQVEFLGGVGQSKKFAILDWRWFIDMWNSNNIPLSSKPTITQSSICQIGKSFRLKLSEATRITDCHIIQVAFVEDKESIPTAKPYAIVPWQTYLAVRTAFSDVRSE